MNNFTAHPRYSQITTLKNLKKTLVVKYGGNAMTDKNAENAFAYDIALLHASGIKVIVVHGGGPQVDDMLSKINHSSIRIDGMRVTDQTTMEIAEMVLGAGVNGKLVNLINHFSNAGVAVGINGKDGQSLIAKKLAGNVDLGLVGEITQVNDKLINTLLDNNFIPVIAPIASDSDAQITYNINADVVAGAIGSAINADELIMLSNIDGVLDDNKRLIHQLTLTDIDELIAKGIIYGGMIPKLSGAIEAVNSGVKTVSIINGCTAHQLIDSVIGEKVGTKIIG